MQNRWIFWLSFSCLGLGCAEKATVVELDQLQLATQADELERFGESLISTGLYERDMAISPDGKEIIYTLGDYNQRYRCLVTSHFRDGVWIAPEILNTSGRYQDIEPFFAKNGDRLFFASNRPLFEDSLTTDYNIWYSDRQADGWATPVALGKNVNTGGDDFYPSVARNGNLYYTATKEEGRGREDIYRSRWENGAYQPAELLDSAINTAYYEFNAYISPEEDRLIFSSWGRPDGLGGGDLYLATKDPQGRWLPARHLPEPINSDKLDYCPFVDEARGNFYFTSERLQAEDTSALSGIAALQNLANAPGNGFGDIYRIKVSWLSEK